MLKPVRCLNVSDVLAERADQFAHSLVHGRRQVSHSDCTLLGFSDTGISVSFQATPTPSILIWLAMISSSWTKSAANIPREETPAHPVYVRGLRANRGPR